MEKITISTASSKSVIVCGKGALKRFLADFNATQVFLVTDSNVYGIYGEDIKVFFPNAEIFVIPAGEKSKNFTILRSIFDKMISSGLTRSGTVVAFGGGVVGDITGLAASLYMRGVNLVQIPTTLLAQVDSSVGGKTGVDFCGVKNVIGSFYQPSQVVVDPSFLNTLPKREIRCGLGEIIKYGALNAYILNLIEKNADNLYDFNFLEKVTTPCIRHKAAVVKQDERDCGGMRKSLNLGHTTGHAFELFYKRKSHGEFVLIGAYYELFIALNLGVCSKDYADKLRELIKKVVKNIPCYDNAAAAKYDKKNSEQSQISMIVPKSIGEWTEITLPVEQYAKQIAACAEAIRCGRW